MKIIIKKYRFDRPIKNKIIEKKLIA